MIGESGLSQLPTKYTSVNQCDQDIQKPLARCYISDLELGPWKPTLLVIIFSMLSFLSSGCCKPPTSCAFTYMNETYWTQNTGVPTVTNDPDCYRWSNDQQTLCFQCDSCKAGVLAGIKKSWRKVAILNIVVLIILVIVYVAGCAAFRNAKRIENDEPIGMARMTKSHPSRFQF